MNLIATAEPALLAVAARQSSLPKRLPGFLFRALIGGARDAAVLGSGGSPTAASLSTWGVSRVTEQRIQLRALQRWKPRHR